MSTPIPQPAGVPLLGNIFNIDPNNTWWSLKGLAEKYGEIFQIKVLGHTIVFIGSVALAEEICDEKRFRKYVGGPIVEIRSLVHNALFTAFDNEDSWGIAHRILAPQLTPEIASSHFNEIRDVTSELIGSWAQLGAKNEIEPLAGLNRLNLEATTLTLFGKRLNCLTGPEHPMLQAMEDSTSEAMKRPNRPGFLNWLYGGKMKRAVATQRNWAADLVKYRAENPSDRRDMLWAMLNAKDPETGKSFTESEVVDEIVTMPIGSSTAPCTIAAGILFLLQNPEVISKARKELDDVVGDGPLEAGHLPRLPYIAGIVRETLRLAYPAPGFNIEPIPRTGDKSPVLLAGGKYQVAHDQAMIIVLAGVNRDPAVFDDPLVFRPERMMGESFERLPAGAKKWFGNGKRECIGKHWAWDFLFIVFAKLIHEVDFEAADANYVLKQDGWFNVRPVNLRVRVKPRGV
ncbi:cytochrome P450-like protein [Cercophora scortea]|uniref:Cytochrome P450-like protein n=1 Tax=Cercophora scortea TaxID=314031 RepID=A0AAE0I6P8_9PEZI|nr:cytochrome P450-like protein [Cercophora scortea]